MKKTINCVKGIIKYEDGTESTTTKCCGKSSECFCYNHSFDSGYCPGDDDGMSEPCTGCEFYNGDVCFASEVV